MINSNVYLDCYENYQKGIKLYTIYVFTLFIKGLCMASLANCPIKCCVNKQDEASSNCVLVVYTIGKTAKLRSSKKIKAGSEILWFYGHKYKYPSQF